MKNTFELIHGSCADQNVDAIVNAANRYLSVGGGICGVIFVNAGQSELEAACRAFETPLADGDAVLTPAFQIKNAKAIIHAIGPNFGQTPDAFPALFNAYHNSLDLLKEHGYHSIAFPLISAGIFGGSIPYPAGESAKQCQMAYQKFIIDHPLYGLDLKLCAFTEREMTEPEAGIASVK